MPYAEMRLLQQEQAQQTTRRNRNSNNNNNTTTAGTIRPPPLPTLPIPLGPDVHYIFNNTDKYSPLRSLTINMWIRGQVSQSELVSADPPYPEEFVMQLARQLLYFSNENGNVFHIQEQEKFHCKGTRGQKRRRSAVDTTQQEESS